MNLIKIFTYSVIILTTFPLISLAETSYLDSAMKANESIVTIRTYRQEIYKSPKASAAFDPRTGRMIIVQKGVKAELKKYGAGVIIHESGLIVTNLHTIRNARRAAIILYDGTTVGAKILSFMGEHDLALLKIEPPYPLKPIVIANSDQAQLGQHITNIGNSELLKQRISGGRISRIGTVSDEEGRTTVELIEVNIDLYKGDSGGPILNQEGELIGMVVAKYHKRHKSTLVIPSNKIKKLLLEFSN